MPERNLRLPLLLLLPLPLPFAVAFLVCHSRRESAVALVLTNSSVQSVQLLSHRLRQRQSRRRLDIHKLPRRINLQEDIIPLRRQPHIDRPKHQPQPALQLQKPVLHLIRNLHRLHLRRADIDPAVHLVLRLLRVNRRRKQLVPHRRNPQVVSRFHIVLKDHRRMLHLIQQVQLVLFATIASPSTPPRSTRTTCTQSPDTPAHPQIAAPPPGRSSSASPVSEAPPPAPPSTDTPSAPQSGRAPDR